MTTAMIADTYFQTILAAVTRDGLPTSQPSIDAARTCLEELVAAHVGSLQGPATVESVMRTAVAVLETVQTHDMPDRLLTAWVGGRGPDEMEQSLLDGFRVQLSEQIKRGHRAIQLCYELGPAPVDIEDGDMEALELKRLCGAVFDNLEGVALQDYRAGMLTIDGLLQFHLGRL